MQEFGRGGGGRGRGREKRGGAGLRGGGLRRAGRAPLPFPRRAPALRAVLPAGRCAAAAQPVWQRLLRALGRRAAAPRARAGEGATFPRAAPSRSQGAPPRGRKRRLGARSGPPGHSEGFPTVRGRQRLEGFGRLFCNYPST